MYNNEGGGVPDREKAANGLWLGYLPPRSTLKIDVWKIDNGRFLWQDPGIYGNNIKKIILAASAAKKQLPNCGRRKKLQEGRNSGLTQSMYQPTLRSQKKPRARPVPRFINMVPPTTMQTGTRAPLRGGGAVNTSHHHAE